jgi:hypothetical protein
LKKLQRKIVEEYESKYAPIGCDGIYFQSFTERGDEYIGGRLNVYHFDMYRISSWDELYSCGYFEYTEEGGVVVAEWSENIENALPENTWYVEFEAMDENKRKITVYHKKETEKLTKNKELQKEIRSQLNALNSIDKNKHINSAISLATLNINADNLITSNNKLCVYNKGIDMFVDLLEDIANAKKFIHLSYYIIQKDKYGERLKNALIRKLKDGVEVRLIYDQIGSKWTSKAFFKDLVNLKRGYVLYNHFENPQDIPYFVEY